MSENDSPQTNPEHPGNCIVRYVGKNHYAVIKIGPSGQRELVRENAPSLDDARDIAIANLAGGRIWYQDGRVIELYRQI
jgi:hypothetical protein